MSANMGTFIKRSIIILAAVLAVFWLKSLQLQHGHFKAAIGYAEAGEMKLAMREYDLALHFYWPLSPYQQKAAEALWDIGEGFEKDDKYRWALLAYSSIRSGFYSARGIFQPGRRWIDRCDEKIADLNVKMLSATGGVKDGEEVLEKAKLMYALKYDGSPDPLWSAVAILAMAWWVGSAIYISFRTFGAGGGLRRRAAVFGALSLAAAIGVWSLALYMA